jgi:methionyl-tRNA formyltransferase
VAEAFRVGFAGTPPFAATALSAILAAGFEVSLVLTRPDARKGRGLQLASSAVKTLAQARGITLLQPSTLRSEGLCAEVMAHPLEVLVVAAYGLILPPAILEWPRHGCLNIHASLLPRWRGAAPIERAVLSGDTQTGISIMQMDAGLDTGPVVASCVVPIARRETAGTLCDKLAAAGAKAIVEVLGKLRNDRRLAAVAQPDEGASYAAKVARHEAWIDWGRDAEAIDRQIRAFNPAPGARTTLSGETLKIWEAEAAPGRFGAPGTVVRADAGGIIVACGDGALVVRELQRSGGKRLTASAFLAGHPLVPNARLGDDPLRPLAV